MARHQKSQLDLAEALGKSQAFVSRRLRGELAFDIGELDQIATWLGIPLVDLLTERAQA
jgi:transcriptional regulator with XRE-family HTH domain